jgi:hypothetical protein
MSWDLSSTVRINTERCTLSTEMKSVDRSARRVTDIGDRTIGFQCLLPARLPQAEATQVRR